MCHVTIVEPIKLKILLDFLLIDIVQNEKNKIRDISQFSFFSQILGPKIGLNDPHPLGTIYIFLTCQILSISDNVIQ